MPTSPLATLAHYLAGEFENQAQAAADPALYVHLRLWQRPIPALSSEQTYTLFLEQASVAAGKPPYRQRVLQLRAIAGQLRGQYFALAEPLKFRGAGRDAACLTGLSSADLVDLPNSEAEIQYQALAGSEYQFQAALPEGQLCSFTYDGQRRYVYLGFDVAPEAGAITLRTYDKGVDPDTGRGLWGALMGPFHMIKQGTFDWPA